MEELVMVAHTMVGEELYDEKAQKFKGIGGGGDITYSMKIQEKKTGKDETSASKAKAYERTPYLVKQRKGVDEVNMRSPAKNTMAPKKQKRKEKVFE
jgi:hypothetical protein